MALVRHPQLVPGRPSDKLQHVVAFLDWRASGRIAFLQAPPLRIGLWLCAFGGELAQTVPALNRDRDICDWIADAATVATMLVLTEMIRMRLTGRSG